MSRYDCCGERIGLRRSRHGMLFGVCRGLAEHVGFSVFWTRVLTVALAIFLEFWPVAIAYVVLALVMKTEPRYAVEYTETAPRKTGGLDERVQRLETIVTSRAYDWDERLRGGF